MSQHILFCLLSNRFCLEQEDDYVKLTSFYTKSVFHEVARRNYMNGNEYGNSLLENLPTVVLIKIFEYLKITEIMCLSKMYPQLNNSIFVPKLWSKVKLHLRTDLFSTEEIKILINFFNIQMKYAILKTTDTNISESENILNLFLERCKNTRVLQISCNPGFNISHKLINFKCLTKLDIENESVADNDIKLITDHLKLVSLIIRTKVELFDGLLYFILKTEKIEEFGVHVLNTNIRDILVKLYKRHKNSLQKVFIKLELQKFDSKILRILQYFPKLIDLHLGNIDFNEQFLSALAELSNLKSLTLAREHLLPLEEETSSRIILINISYMTHLTLKGLTLSDDGMKLIGYRASSLISLKLLECRVEESVLYACLEKLKKLKVFVYQHVENNAQISFNKLIESRILEKIPARLIHFSIDGKTFDKNHLDNIKKFIKKIIPNKFCSLKFK